MTNLLWHIVSAGNKVAAGQFEKLSGFEGRVENLSRFQIGKENLTIFKTGKRPVSMGEIGTKCLAILRPGWIFTKLF